jgi:excinuclease ABC subunit C
VYLASSGHDFSVVSRWFHDELGVEPALLATDERRHETVLAMAYQNAKEDLAKRVKERGAGPSLDELQGALGLSRRPERIEGFDIAQLDGSFPVASLVSFKDGIPDKKNYRHFRLKTVIGIVDDFQAMREAVSRRYSRVISEGSELPDFILIDGGIGQVNAAKGVLDALGIDMDIAGLAKRDEELWLPGATDPIRLSKNSEALKVLQFVRDETHRFATGLNQKLRSKTLKLESLESIAGIGPVKAAALLKAFGSLEALAAATPVEIAGAANMSESLAAAAKAAARLALSDQKAERERLSSGSSASRKQAPRQASRPAGTDRAPSSSTHRSSAKPTIADLAAEADADYSPDEKPENS